jgi:hypothetical protein
MPKHVFLTSLMQAIRFNSNRQHLFPRLIVLTNLLTWGVFQLDTTGAGLTVDHFKNRVPAMGVSNLSALENQLFNISRGGVDIGLLGIGLVYGGGGYDFESLFR